MDPKSTALIVVDMNRANLDVDLNYLPVSPEDSRRLLHAGGEKVTPVFRKFHCPITFVKTIHRVHHVTGESFSFAGPFWQSR